MATTRAGEHEGIEHGELRPIIGAGDETFLQRMRLVLMDTAGAGTLWRAHRGKRAR